MRTNRVVSVLMMLMILMMLTLLAACAPPATPVGTPPQEPAQPAAPIETPAPPVDVNAPAIENNRLLLARQLRVDPSTVQVISVEKMEWSDSCLGLGQANESCAAVVTPGYKITFSVAGQEYVIHTDEGGSQVRVASAPTQESATPGTPIETPATPVDVNAPAIENNRLLLARQLHVDPSTVQVISAEKVEWSDSCLGLGQANESCAAVVTPGYKITFSVAGQEYVIHTDEGGYQTRVASAPAPTIGEPIMAWSGPLDMRACAEAVIGTEGVGFGLCGSEAKLGGKFASEARQDVLKQMAAKYASFEGSNEFGSIRFTGQGSTAATAAEQRLITRWAQMATMEAGGGESLAGMEYRGPAEIGSGDTSKCAVMRLGTPIEAVLGACDGTATDKDMGKRIYLEWEQLRDRFAPFVYETVTETITFEGMGLESSEAWQRAILAWARARHAELASGKASAAANTAVSWHLGQDYSQKNVCLHLTVLNYGYAQAEEIACEGGEVLKSASDWLTSEELVQLDEWLYQRAPLSIDKNYIAGQGTQEMSEADQAALNNWVMTVHARIWNAAALASLPPTALANCPAERDGTRRVVDARRGFCLFIPAAYTVFNPNPNEIVIAKDSLLNVTEPRLSIAVTAAGARTVEQVADDIVATMPGFDLKRSTIDIAGQEAVVLDNVPGQDLMRRVLFVRCGLATGI